MEIVLHTQTLRRGFVVRFGLKGQRRIIAIHRRGNTTSAESNCWQGAINHLERVLQSIRPNCGVFVGLKGASYACRNTVPRQIRQIVSQTKWGKIEGYRGRRRA